MSMAIFNHVNIYKIIMKIKLIFLSAALTISTAGCEQKTNLPAQSTIKATQKIQETIEQKIEVKQEAVKTLPVSIESSDKKSAVVPKESTEQSLAEISKQSREITKTQVSKARNRAQIAEDEMLQDLAQSK